MQQTIQSSFNDIGLLIARIKNKMRKRMNDKLKPYDLTSEQRAILLILCSQGDLTQIQLCEQISMEPSNLSTTLKRLENKNFIDKIDHPNDPRAYLVRATKQTLSIAEELRNLGIVTQADLFKGIELSDLRITYETLKKLDKNL